ncbi:MAG TPA: competence/damage-inducible protein A [Actinomycetota bacterium]
MRAEIVGVGTEILLGQISNSNAQWISERLGEIGVDVVYHQAVGDNEDRIREAFSLALSRADVVIATGGLGPTQDDITREGLAAALGVPLIRRPEIEDFLRQKFQRLGRAMPEMNLRQADVPEGARAIDNPRGTAPGLIIEVGGKPLYAVPGVPREMEGMLERVVLPDLAARAGEGRAIVSRTLRTAGLGESALAERLTPLWESMGEEAGVTLAYLASPGEVRVRLTTVGATREQALATIAPVEEAVRKELGDLVYGLDDETLEAAVGRLLRAAGQTLASAESLTGGLAGGRITAAAGASDYYLGGVVVYATDAKAELLGVDAALLAEHGPVSEPVAGAMAEGVRRLFGAGVGIATTGVAGPTEQDNKPVGSFCLGVADPDGTVTRSTRAPGDRAQVRAWATTTALDLVRRRLEGKA